MLTPRNDLINEDALREYAEKDRDKYLKLRPRWAKIKGKKVPVFHASEADACSRRLWYAMKGEVPLPNDLFSTLLLPDGDRHADSMVHWMEVMGHKVTDREKEFKKLLKTEEGTLAVVGHIDGILTAPSGAAGIGEVKYLFEMKGLSTHTWKKTDPTEVVNRGYRYQAQVYMWMCKIPRTIFLIKDKNSSQLKPFEMPENKKVIKDLVEKWKKIVRALKKDKAPDRDYDARSLQCKWCRHNQLCRPSGG